MRKEVSDSRVTKVTLGSGREGAMIWATRYAIDEVRQMRGLWREPSDPARNQKMCTTVYVAS